MSRPPQSSPFIPRPQLSPRREQADPSFALTLARHYGLIAGTLNAKGAAESAWPTDPKKLGAAIKAARDPANPQAPRERFPRVARLQKAAQTGQFSTFLANSINVTIARLGRQRRGGKHGSAANVCEGIADGCFENRRKMAAPPGTDFIAGLKNAALLIFDCRQGFQWNTGKSADNSEDFLGIISIRCCLGLIC